MSRVNKRLDAAGGQTKAPKSVWPTRALGDVCDVIGGGTPSKEIASYYGGAIPWATVRDMKADLIENTECSITTDAVLASATNIIPAGSVIIATRVGLGKVCILGQDTAINQDIRGIIPRNGNVKVKFLYHWLRYIAPRIVAEGSGATVQGVKLPFIKSLQMPLPTIPEQDRIVAILDGAFEGIASAQERIRASVEAVKPLSASILQSLLYPAEGITDEIPLGKICEVKDGTHDSPKYVDRGIPFVTQKNIRKSGLTLDNTRFIRNEDHEQFYKRSNVATGDVLISMIGANRGMACIVETATVFSIKNVGLVKKNSQVDARYLNYYLSSERAQEYVKSCSKGGAQEFVGLTELRKFPFPFAPLTQQQCIASKLDELMAMKSDLEQTQQKKINLLDELKQSLLYQAFSGTL